MSARRANNDGAYSRGCPCLKGVVLLREHQWISGSERHRFLPFYCCRSVAPPIGKHVIHLTLFFTLLVSHAHWRKLSGTSSEPDVAMLSHMFQGIFLLLLFLFKESFAPYAAADRMLHDQICTCINVWNSLWWQYLRTCRVTCAAVSQPASQPLSMYIKYSAGKERQNVAKHYLAICSNKSISRRDVGNIGSF